MRTRLIVWNVVTILFIMGTCGAAAEQMMRSAILVSIDRELARRAQGLAEHPDPRPKHLAEANHHTGNPDPTQPYSGFDKPQVLDLQGNVRMPESMLQPWDSSAALAAARGKQQLTTVTVQGYPFRVATCPYPAQGQPLGVVQVPYPLGQAYHSLEELNRMLLNLLPVALLLVAGSAAFLAGRALRPVKAIVRTTEQIGATNLTARLNTGTRDEFGELAAVINRMLDRLQGLVERERRFTADASHELQTPLAVIKANASLCLTRDTDLAGYKRGMEAINRASTSMTNLTQDLLLLARADAGSSIRETTVLPISDIIADAAALCSTSSTDRAEITIQEASPELCVTGCEQELVRVFVNLLQNARRHTPASGSITVAARQEGGCIKIAVADTGSGIAPEHLSHLGERFYRADKARSRAEGGTGLGLAIVKTILTAHSGQIQFESTTGTGTTATVTLPAAAPLS